MKKIAILSLLAALLPFISFAHEGHGHTHGFTITHYFVEPEHLILMLIAAAGGVLLFSRFRKKEKSAK
ncbi:MAG: hypothetical protein WBC06_08930 [Chitinophagaceae bacterium]